MKQKPQNKYELVDIIKLIPYVNNARTHSDKQIKQIAKSIKEFGFISPCIIDKDNNIIAGHGRIMAASTIKVEHVPCVRVEYLTEKQKKAYILADNKHALNAGWDEGILASELAELKNMDFDFDVIGFDELPEFNPDLPDEDEGKESPEEKLILIVTLPNQDDKQMLFDELNSRGYKVKV